MTTEIKYYLEKKKEGIEYSEIRKEMIQNGYSLIEITFMINEIDDNFIEFKETKQKLNLSNISSNIFYLIIGIIFLFIFLLYSIYFAINLRLGIIGYINCILLFISWFIYVL